jgi:hypothetical protein
VQHLKRFHINDDTVFPDRTPTLPVPVHVDTGDEYIIHEILDHKQRPLRFLARFAGHPDVSDAWLHENDFVDIDGTITEALYNYVVQHPNVGSKHLRLLIFPPPGR